MKANDNSSNRKNGRNALLLALAALLFVYALIVVAGYLATSLRSYHDERRSDEQGNSNTAVPTVDREMAINPMLIEMLRVPLPRGRELASKVWNLLRSAEPGDIDRHRAVQQIRSLISNYVSIRSSPELSRLINSIQFKYSRHGAEPRWRQLVMLCSEVHVFRNGRIGTKQGQLLSTVVAWFATAVLDVRMSSRAWAVVPTGFDTEGRICKDGSVYLLGRMFDVARSDRGASFNREYYFVDTLMHEMIHALLCQAGIAIYDSHLHRNMTSHNKALARAIGAPYSLLPDWVRAFSEYIACSYGVEWGTRSGYDANTLEGLAWHGFDDLSMVQALFR